jgi:hypothetical protein
MREDVPVILGPQRHAASRGRVARAALGDGVGEFPAVRRDFFLFPLALLVVPLVPAAYFHAGIFFPLEFLELVVGGGDVPFEFALF